jgi:hypothetical protein
MVSRVRRFVGIIVVGIPVSLLKSIDFNNAGRIDAIGKFGGGLSLFVYFA